MGVAGRSKPKAKIAKEPGWTKPGSAAQSGPSIRWPYPISPLQVLIRQSEAAGTVFGRGTNKKGRHRGVLPFFGITGG